MIAENIPAELRISPTPRAQWAVIITLFVAGFLEFRLFDRHVVLATVYICPGIALATTYSMNRSGRLRMLVAMLMAMAMGYMAGGLAPATAIVSAGFMGAQAWVGAAILGKIAPRGLDLARARSIINVALVALVVVPIFALVVEFVLVDARWGIIGVHPALAGGTGNPLAADTPIRWLLPHALGIILAVPLILDLFERSRRKRTKWWNGERLAILGCNLAVTAVTFYSDGRFFLFLICPPLVWAGLRLGIRDTASAVLVSLLTASFATAHGHGPAEVLHIDPAQRTLFLELAYLCAYGCILPIAASLEARRRLDSDLARSLELTAQILRNMREVVFRTDAKGCWAFLNAAWEDVTGYTVTDSLGVEGARLIVAEDRQEPGLAYASLIRGDVEEVTVECRIRRKDRDLRDVVINCQAVRDLSGEFIGTTGTMRDISEQRRYMQALEASESRFRRLCDTAPIGIVRSDMQGALTYANQRFEQIISRPAGSLVGQLWLDVLEIERPDLSYEISRRLKSPTEVYEHEFEFHDEGGLSRWLTFTATGEFDESGQMTGYINAVTEITQRKAAEAELARRTRELRLLAENVNDIIVRIGFDGTLRYATPSVRDVLGINPQDLTGSELISMIHSEDKPVLRQAFGRLARGELETYTLSYRTRRNGSPAGEAWDDYIWLESNCRLLRDHAGQPHELIASVRDITKRKELELELTDARLRAEDAVKTKSAFLANLSHEIRTPMNGVIGLTELLLGHDLEPDSRRFVQLISESGATMMNLLNDILEIAKIDAGRLLLSREQFDLHECLANSFSLMSASAAGKRLELRLAIAPDMPRHMLGDSLRLRQVLANLVGNAIKFTHTGHVAIFARCIANVLEIRVEDTGIGIDPEVQATVFEEFFQANAEIADSYGGTGLGLPISRRIAEAMGGSLTLSSQRGQGTTMTLRIPACFVEMPAQIAPVPAGKATVHTGAPLRILAAEDNQTNQIILTGMLQKLGHTAALAGNGEEVIAMVEQAAAAAEPYDLILMDIQMPKMDGIAATKRLRAMGYDASRLHIIAVTASGYQEDIAGCLNAGMQAHLTKPVRLADLSTALAALIPAGAPAGQPVTDHQNTAKLRPNSHA